MYALSDEELAALDPKALVERMRGIHKGMSAEHEFAAIASWLGNPRLIIHSDEVLATDKHFRVPDFLVVARRGGRDIPFLVEVKEEKEDKIRWTEKYLASMREFAMLLKLPLLVAWKRWGLWALFDSELFGKKTAAYHVSFDTAMKNNLMTALFGNVFIVVNEGFRLEIEYKLLDQSASDEAFLPAGQYESVITEAGLFTKRGKVPNDLSKLLFPIFITKAAGAPTFERSGEFIRETYATDPEGMFNASDILFTNLSWHRDPENSVDWLIALRKGLVAPAQDLRTVLQRGIEVGAIQYVLEQQPATIPSFLDGID